MLSSLPSAVARDSGARVSRLANGLSVLTEAMPTGNAAVGLWIHVGTRDEPEDASGVAHLVEHMLFKGTQTRNAFELARAFEDVGGRLNAHTSREQTAYYARVLPGDVPLAVELFADMLQHSLYDEEELARERDVIVQEVRDTYDQPDELLYDELQTAMFPGQIFGRPLLGDAELIAKMPRTSIVDYVTRTYHAGNISLVATGEVDHAQVMALAERFFGSLRGGMAPARVRPAYAPARLSINRPVEQVNLALLWPGASYDDPHATALNVMTQALGEGFSSRLWQEVREKAGLVYSIAAGTTQWLDAGLFGIYASATPENCDAVLRITARELARFADTLTEAEVARAKTQLIANLTMDLEGTLERAEHLGHYFQIYGRVPDRAELTAKIASVALPDVQRAARRIVMAPVTQGAVGPLDERAPLPAFAELLAA